ncbi:hypothetical protein [Streptomyces sp. WMMC940]|uniref:hypothetical protein n=1 Tax=Streptomyces sp. WMMC940 TaxID=3015153 RepID=UPI0022B631E0|nr:hypothetical protein [Streptomyces sp. WMMC940]MCZ7460429.1 hypothetical protein [Streptomyces sp. WMMC940]
MTLSFKASMVGPSRVGKTTLLTAILAETETMLAGSGISLIMDEATEMRVRKNRKDLRRAIEAREFDAASLGGSQSMALYDVGLQAVGDDSAGIPFSILDYPGGWLDPSMRARAPQAKENWAACEAHITESLMLLVPVEAAVLMEAVTPAQRRAAADLLGFEDVQAMARKWARARNLPEHRDEPAVLVLAPLKCEKYFDDNGGKGREGARLRQLVREKYKTIVRVVQEETKNRSVRVIYAPIDTYGCVDLMEGEWIEMRDADGDPTLDFRGHYRFREIPPEVRPKAAGTVMQELCRCVVSGQETMERRRAAAAMATYQAALERQSEPKGFWGALDYYVFGEALENRNTRLGSQQVMTETARRQEQLKAVLERIAREPADERVEEW